MVVLGRIVSKWQSVLVFLYEKRISVMYKNGIRFMCS